jgi:hypothetical protein
MKENYNEETDTPRQLQRHGGKAATILAAFLGLLLGVIGIIEYIDHRVAKELESDATLDRIARKLSCYLVFDGTGAVLNDPHKIFGEVVTGITLRTSPDPYRDSGRREPDGQYGFVTITFAKPLEIPPVLHYYDTASHIWGKRLGETHWEFEIRHVLVAGDSGPTITHKDARFLIQVYR